MSVVPGAVCHYTVCAGAAPGTQAAGACSPGAVHTPSRTITCSYTHQNNNKLQNIIRDGVIVLWPLSDKLRMRPFLITSALVTVLAIKVFSNKLGLVVKKQLMNMIYSAESQI